MKKNIAIIILAVLLISGAYFGGKELLRMRSDLKRLRTNQVNTMTGNSSAVKQLTRAEFKEIYREVIDSVLEVRGIKGKQVDHFIISDYRIRDTVITSYLTTLDNNTEQMSFLISKPCYTLSGEVRGGEIETDLKVTDKITTVLYWQRKIWWLGLRWGKKEHKAIILSGCSGDTLTIQDNVEVVKN